MKYKLTNQDGYTRKGETNETLWGENVTHAATGEGNELCTDGVIHYYDSPEEAAFYNPIHADIKDPVCWEAKGRKVAHDGVKGGCKTVTTIRKVPLPEITTEQRVEIAIRCALTVYSNPSFVLWANNWLSGKDRSAAAAAAAARAAAARAAEAAAVAAAEVAAGAAAEVAWAARKINVKSIIRKVIGGK